jgi:hypothetical protein
MPTIATTTIAHDSTPSLPTTDGIQRICQPTDCFCEVGTDLNGPLVIHDCITSAAFVFDSIGEIRKGYVEISIALDCSLVHVDRSVQLTDVLQETTQIGVQVSVVFV